MENTDFVFDNSFMENEETSDLYECSVKPIVQDLFDKSVVTVFAYGQTGSGKTFTMNGFNDYVIEDLFKLLDKDEVKEQDPCFYVAFYEIYRGILYDLINNRKKLTVQEDYN